MRRSERCYLRSVAGASGSVDPSSNSFGGTCVSSGFVTTNKPLTLCYVIGVWRDAYPIYVRIIFPTVVILDAGEQSNSLKGAISENAIVEDKTVVKDCTWFQPNRIDLWRADRGCLIA